MAGEVAVPGDAQRAPCCSAEAHCGGSKESALIIQAHGAPIKREGHRVPGPIAHIARQRKVVEVGGEVEAGAADKERRALIQGQAWQASPLCYGASRKAISLGAALDPGSHAASAVACRQLRCGQGEVRAIGEEGGAPSCARVVGHIGDPWQAGGVLSCSCSSAAREGGHPARGAGVDCSWSTAGGD
jgi:hypothetical protein